MEIWKLQYTKDIHLTWIPAEQGSSFFPIPITNP